MSRRFKLVGSTWYVRVNGGFPKPVVTFVGATWAYMSENERLFWLAFQEGQIILSRETVKQLNRD